MKKIDLIGVIIYFIILIIAILVLFFIDTSIKMKIAVLLLFIIYNETFGRYIRKKEKRIIENNKVKFSQYSMKKKRLE